VSEAGLKRIDQVDCREFKCPISTSNGFGYCYHFASRSVYMVGSPNPSQHPAKAECFRLNAHTQLSGPMLRQARKEHGTVCLGDFIIAAGGKGINDEVLSSVEMSQVQDTQKAGICNWQLVEALPRATYGNSMATSIYGSFFSLGGADSMGTVVSWVFQFELKTGRWSDCSPMNQARAFFMCCSYRGKVFVAGGMGSDNNLLQSLEVYDVSTNKWTMLAQMPKTVARGQMMATQGKLIVFPCPMKRSAKLSYEPILIYQIDQDEWQVDAQVLDLPNVQLVALTDD
ncbi:hypothetical protein Ciccas_013258, partial [Cichlidogyrus casuarinus]